MSTTASAERVGRYQLLEPIGIGCCGAVARAKVFGVAGFERQFAVKRFHAELTASSSSAQALSAAARAYGSLEHPRIARMSEFGVAQGVTFTAVEFVAGLDAMRLLSEVKLAGGTLAAGGALTLVSQAARAVGYAHGRGLSHLGLAPTNVIVTSDGDIKITDFGVLAATLPAQPTNVPRLANRIAYLAPEQIAGEATSAATDVFSLGVLAYELVTGQRAFHGDTPADIAKAITSGPPLEPPLPRPIVRVLQRCLARSPFERFPDARALADALDAALRVAPVPGTRKDIGAQVKETLERLAALNEGGHSGVVALNVGTGPVRRLDPVDVATLGSASRDSTPSLGSNMDPGDPAMDVPTLDFERPDKATPPTPEFGPAVTQPDMLRTPLATMPGIAPPPIPVPQGIAPLLPSLPMPGAPPATLMGIPPVARPQNRPMIPPMTGAIPKIPTIPAAPPPTPPPVLGRIATREVEKLPRPPTGGFIPDGLARAANQSPSATILGTAPPPPLRDSTPALPEAPMDLVPNQDLTPLPPPSPAEDDFSGLVDDDPPVRAITAGEPSADESLTGGGPSSSVEMPRAIELEVDFATSPGLAVGGPRRAPSATAEISNSVQERLATNSTRPTRDIEPFVSEQIADELARKPTATGEPDDDQIMEISQVTALEPSEVSPLPPPAMPSPAMTPPARPTPLPTRATPPPMPVVAAPPLETYPTGARPAIVDVDNRIVEEPKSKLPWIIGGIVGVALLGGIAYVVKDAISDEGMPVATKPTKPGDGPPVGSNSGGSNSGGSNGGAGSAVADGGRDAGAGVAPDATVVAVGPSDAATPSSAVDASVAAAAIDAGVAAIEPTPTKGPADKLVIDSTPKGAFVYIDGTNVGTTPHTMQATTDRHNLVLLSPGHDLYQAQVDGHGSFTIPLKEVTPSGGPAGIKVIKCAPNRYYVFADGKPTGMLCPTERIQVELGDHVIEIYDAVTEQRRKFDVSVKETRNSFRVKID